MCRQYGLSLEDFSADRGDDRLGGGTTSAEGPDGRATDAALRQWMHGKCAWLGGATTRRALAAFRHRVSPPKYDVAAIAGAVCHHWLGGSTNSHKPTSAFRHWHRECDVRGLLVPAPDLLPFLQD